MLSRTEIERLAQAAHAYRPDWPVQSLVTLIGADHATRAYRDVAVALAWVCTDTDTRTPKRLSEAGPWWGATGPASAASDARFERCREPGHSSFPAWNCSACRADELVAERTGAPLPDRERVDDLQRVVNAAGADRVRAALEEASRP